MVTDAIEARYEVEVHRLQDELKSLTPGTDEYKSVHEELLKALEVMNETTKIEDSRKSAKTDTVVKVTTFARQKDSISLTAFTFDLKLLSEMVLQRESSLSIR